MIASKNKTILRKNLFVYFTVMNTIKEKEWLLADFCYGPLSFILNLMQ